jgi:hypothetical protein
MTITHITPREQELMARVAELEKDAARFEWLLPRFLCADFAYGDPSECCLVFVIPHDMRVSADLRKTIDNEMQLK